MMTRIRLRQGLGALFASAVAAGFTLELSAAGAVADYSFGMRVKHETKLPGNQFSAHFEAQVIAGSIYFEKGVKTEVFRTVPFSLAFTLKEVGGQITAATSAKAATSKDAVRNESAAGITTPGTRSAPTATRSVPRIRRVPTPQIQGGVR